jgi:hypothetical protein
MYLAAYDADGFLEWAVQGGSDSDGMLTQDLALADTDSAVLLGGFFGTLVLNAGLPDEVALDAGGGHGCFLARYGPDGALLWAVRTSGGCQVTEEQRVAVTADGAVLVLIGELGGGVTFDPGGPDEIHIAEPGSFVAEYGADGAFHWARSVAGYNLGATTVPGGGFALTGKFWGSEDDPCVFGPGDENETSLFNTPCDEVNCCDSFVARYEPDGSLRWVVKEGGGGGCSRNRGNDLAAFSDGSLSAIGEFAPPAMFGAGEPGETTLEANGRYDIFVMRLAP